jgi:hypothetical protein
MAGATKGRNVTVKERVSGYTFDTLPKGRVSAFSAK